MSDSSRVSFFAPFVSVLVPVFNDSERLKICLEALENQTYSPNLYEVIVVDNGSDEDVKSAVSQFAWAIVVYESRAGSYAARNHGISLARGDILAFTDSDCIPAEDWIENGVANLMQVPNCGLVAGKIEIYFKDPNHPTAVELYDQVIAFPQKSYVEKEKFAVTANLFTFRSVLDEIGLFKDMLASGGDFEWGRRVFSAGYRQIYADNTRVAHPARSSLSKISQKATRVIGGHFELSQQANSHQTIFDILKEFAQDLKPPRKDIINVYSNKKLTKFSQKLKVISVLLFVRYLRAWKKLELNFMYCSHPNYLSNNSKT
ncbi:MAG: glycosyl transferase family 2 [Cyanobacteria bacterium QH_9_48_43]|jgi:glycosyltransferase involved in cell wall biosynthesis|nr:MAG: glycosyl transferase family 2 [Cyanobacteria bacterium QH_9_48_43]